MTDQDRVNVAPLGLSLCFDKLSYNAYILFENLLTEAVSGENLDVVS